MRRVWDERANPHQRTALIACLPSYEVVEVILVLSMTEPRGCCFSSNFLSYRRRDEREEVGNE